MSKKTWAKISNMGKKCCLTCKCWGGNRTGRVHRTIPELPPDLIIECVQRETGICSVRRNSYAAPAPAAAILSSSGEVYQDVRCEYYKALSVEEIMRILQNGDEVPNLMAFVKEERAKAARGETARPSPSGSPTIKDAFTSRWSEDCKSNKVKIKIKLPTVKGHCNIYDAVANNNLHYNFDVPGTAKLKLDEPKLLEIKVRNEKSGKKDNLLLFVCPGDTIELTKDETGILQAAPCKANGKRKITATLSLGLLPGISGLQSHGDVPDLHYVKPHFDTEYETSAIRRCDRCRYYDDVNISNGYETSRREMPDGYKTWWEPKTQSICNRWIEQVDGYHTCDEFTPRYDEVIGSIAHLIQMKNLGSYRRLYTPESEAQYSMRKKILPKVSKEITETIGHPVDLATEDLGSYVPDEKCPKCNEHTTRYHFFITERQGARASLGADLALALFARTQVIRNPEAYMNRNYHFTCEAQVCDKGCGYWKVVEVKDAGQSID